MKTPLFILSGMLLACNAGAQTQKGNGILGGNVAVNYTRQESSNIGSTTWTPVFTLTAGRFWKDNWLAGLALSGSATLARQPISQNLDQSYTNSSVSGSLTPFVRRYWSFNSVYLFAGAGLSASVTHTKQSYFDENGRLVEDGRKFNTFSVNPRLEVGINYFVTNRLGLQLVANTTALPLTTTGLNAGLVYWTGSDRLAHTREERSNAQTDAGKWVLEGSFSVNTQKNSQLASLGGVRYESSNTTYSFSPSVGFFIKKNSLLGVSIPVSYDVDKLAATGGSTADNTLWSLGISPYFQRYWMSTRLTPYTRVNAGYARYISGSIGGNSINGGLTIGLAYMAGERFIIETSLASASVSYLTADQSSGNGNNAFWNAGVSAGLTGNFAIRYVLQ